MGVVLPICTGRPGQGMEEGWMGKGSRLGRADLGGMVVGEEVVEEVCHWGA